MIPSFLIGQDSGVVNTGPCHRSLCAAQGENHGDPAEGKVDKVPEGRRGEKGAERRSGLCEGRRVERKGISPFWGLLGSIFLGG
jgi:hypothetical protein